MFIKTVQTSTSNDESVSEWAGRQEKKKAAVRGPTKLTQLPKLNKPSRAVCEHLVLPDIVKHPAESIKLFFK